MRAGIWLPAIGFQFAGYGFGLPLRRRVRRKGDRRVENGFPSDSGERDLVLTIVFLAVNISGTVTFGRNGQSVTLLDPDRVGVVVLLEPVTSVGDFDEVRADHGELPCFPRDPLSGLCAEREIFNSGTLFSRLIVGFHCFWHLSEARSRVGARGHPLRREPSFLLTHRR